MTNGKVEADRLKAVPARTLNAGDRKVAPTKTPERGAICFVIGARVSG